MQRRHVISVGSKPWGVVADRGSERIVVALEHAIEVWDPSTNERLRRVEGAFDPKLVSRGVALVAGRKDGAFHFVPLDPGAPVVTGEAGGRLVTNVVEIAGGFVTGDWNGRVTVRDERGAILRSFTAGEEKKPARITLLDPERILVHGSTMAPRVVQLADGRVERTLGLTKNAGSDVVHRVDAARVVVHGAPNEAELLSLETGKKIWRVKAKVQAYAGALRWGHFVIGNRNGLYLVDLATGVPKAQIATGSVDLLDVLADGRALGVVDDYAGVAVFGESGSIASCTSGHGRIAHARAHPTQPRAFTWSNDGTVAVWDL